MILKHKPTLQSVYTFFPSPMFEHTAHCLWGFAFCSCCGGDFHYEMMLKDVLFSIPLYFLDNQIYSLFINKLSKTLFMFTCGLLME